MWFIGVEVEQEKSAPPPKKKPGSAPASHSVYNFKLPPSGHLLNKQPSSIKRPVFRGTQRLFSVKYLFGEADAA